MHPARSRVRLVPSVRLQAVSATWLAKVHMKPTATSEVVRPPADPQIRIWRYMDFTKFVATVEYSGLFFPRCRQFDDPFEGSFPRANEPIRRESLVALNLRPELISARLSNRSAFYQWNRHWVLASCWHMGPCESAALWRLYSKTADAVCIVSTYQRLRDCLPALGDVAAKTAM